MSGIKQYFEEKITWDAVKDAEFPFRSVCNGDTLRIRLNDFPAENLYTLVVGSKEVSFDDWPARWKKSVSKSVVRPKSQTAGANGSYRSAAVVRASASKTARSLSRSRAAANTKSKAR